MARAHSGQRVLYSAKSALRRKQHAASQTSAGRCGSGAGVEALVVARALVDRIGSHGEHSQHSGRG